MLDLLEITREKFSKLLEGGKKKNGTNVIADEQTMDERRGGTRRADLVSHPRRCLSGLSRFICRLVCPFNVEGIPRARQREIMRGCADERQRESIRRVLFILRVCGQRKRHYGQFAGSGARGPITCKLLQLFERTRSLPHGRAERTDMRECFPGQQMR